MEQYRALKEAYQKVYGMERMKKAFIADLLFLSNGTPQLKVSFLRDAQYWNADAF